MKIVKPYKMMFQIGKNNISRAMVRERKVYNHYTNVKSLECIMKTKTLLLNRIDSVNDLDEKDYLKDPEVYSLIYISCFTYKEIESIPHWFIYTKENEGVRISFELKDNLSLKSIIDYHSALHVIGSDNSKEEYFSHGNFFNSSSSKWSVEIQTSDIIYDSNIINDNNVIYSIDGEKYINLTPIAKLKTEEWDYEYETRIIGTFRSTYENIDFSVPSHLLLPLDFNNIKIKVTMNPWADNLLEEKINRIFEELDFHVDYTIVKSKLHGKIVRK